MKYTKAVILVLMIVMLTACSKKRYVSPLETPNVTIADADDPYSLDFTQLNNSLIEYLEEKEIYGFVKDVTADGNNDTREIVIKAETKENVSEDAINLLLADATKAVVDDAHTQDFRIDSYSDDSYGNLSDIYSIQYIVTCNGENIVDLKVEKGESIPYDPSMSIDNIVIK